MLQHTSAPPLSLVVINADTRGRAAHVRVGNGELIAKPYETRRVERAASFTPLSPELVADAVDEGAKHESEEGAKGLMFAIRKQ